MRNYLILNGNNSNEITGLLIQNLPPISKPLMRTAIEEIDGRDGDIVTNLGYSAYDKEVSIGLYGSYDVDEIIKYFHDNQKGQVTFSNEPDKYYNYEIIEQIDFERLIRFRTAIVTLHCQPFKYPTEETPIEIPFNEVSNEDTEMTLNNTADAPMKIILKPNTSQETTPNPDYPQDIHVVSGDNTKTISNGDNTQSQTYPLNLPVENLFDKDNSGILLNTGLSGTTGGTSANNERNTSYYINILSSTTYTLSGATFAAKCFYDENKTFISSTSSNTFTTPSNAKYLRFAWNNAEDFSQLQLEKGSKANSYTSYGTTPIEYCEIGGYKDEFFKNEVGSEYYDSSLELNKWYLKKRIGKVISTGAESWALSSSDVFYRSLSSSILTTGITTKSDYFKAANNQTSAANAHNNNPMNSICSSSSGNKRLYVKTNIVSTAADFQNWLSTHNMTTYYVLATPEDILLNDTLQTQLDNIRNNARSYEGTTNISQTNNDLPLKINATAMESGSGTGIVDNEGNIYSKPTLDLEGSGIVGIYLNNNQMFSVDLSNSNEIVIDTTNLEAYNPTTTQLMNRQVTGNYDNFKLNVGESNIKIEGVLTKATISNYTRWL